MFDFRCLESGFLSWMANTHNWRAWDVGTLGHFVPLPKIKKTSARMRQIAQFLFVFVHLTSGASMDKLKHRRSTETRDGSQELLKYNTRAWTPSNPTDSVPNPNHEVRVRLKSAASVTTPRRRKRKYQQLNFTIQLPRGESIWALSQKLETVEGFRKRTNITDRLFLDRHFYEEVEEEAVVDKLLLSSRIWYAKSVEINSTSTVAVLLIGKLFRIRTCRCLL